jgi:hypothetical protein
MSFVERHVRVPDTVTDADKEHLREFFCAERDVFHQHILALLGEIHEAFMYVYIVHTSAYDICDAGHFIIFSLVNLQC